MKAPIGWRLLAAVLLCALALLPAPSGLAQAPPFTKPMLLRHGGWPRCVAFSPDGKYLASGGADKSVKVWNTATGKNVARFTGHTASVMAVAFSPDGKFLASASQDKTVRLWDLDSRKSAVTLSGHTNHVYALSFSPDGKLLASGSRDTTVRLWDLETRKTSLTLKVGAIVRSVSFSPDGGVLATPGKGLVKQVLLWDVASGRNTAAYRGHANSPYSVAFSPDGKLLASAGGDGTIRLWAPKGKNIATFKHGVGAANLIVLAFGGRDLLASSAEDGKVKLWRPSRGEVLATFPVSGPAVWTNPVALSSDGRFLASGAEDGLVRLWSLEPPKKGGPFPKRP